MRPGSGCVSFSASSLLVRAGTANRYVGGVTRRVSLVKEHSQYNIGARWNNDVALIRVSEAFPLGPSIQPIALAPSGLLLPEGAYTRVAGWGATWVTVDCNIHQGGGVGGYLGSITGQLSGRYGCRSELVPPLDQALERKLFCDEYTWKHDHSGGGSVDNLLQVDLPLWTNAQCAQIFDNGRLTDEMVCAGYIAGGKDTCQKRGESTPKWFVMFQGDSGGALVLEGVQVGVVSWGNVCAEYPGVYARDLVKSPKESGPSFEPRRGRQEDLTPAIGAKTLDVSIIQIGPVIGSHSQRLWRFQNYPKALHLPASSYRRKYVSVEHPFMSCWVRQGIAYCRVFLSKGNQSHTTQCTSVSGFNGQIY
uniref:Peptidase S1 domain-containing protein n=1 Tax=Timema poppense TaxID=170557 RepID=A0A7R9DMX4_TIMPO|nr:unnamed protein product [Timema poppensis]